jgi:aminodeoxychorismate lyase
MKKFVWINQKFVEEKSATISVNDRAFSFGDGLFETCKIFGGKIYDFEAHKKRLSEGLKTLKISAEISGLERTALKLIEKNQIKNGILKIEISRGESSFGYAPDKASKPCVIIKTLDEKAAPSKALSKIILGISSIRRPAKNSLPIHCKTKNSLPSILTKIEAQENGFFDAVMLSQKNFISETSSANIFWIKQGQVFTASQNCDILPGCVREKILKISPVKIFEVQKRISELQNADEIFLTNSSFLVLPVDEIFFGKKRKKLQKNFGEMFAELVKSDVEDSCKK